MEMIKDDVPILLEEQERVQVEWHGRKMQRNLEKIEYVQCMVKMNVWKLRRLKKNGWKNAMLFVSDGGIEIRYHGRIKSKIPLQHIIDIQQEQDEIHIRCEKQKIIRFQAQSLSLVCFWIEILQHNRMVFQEKHDQILHASPLQDEAQIAGRFQDFLNLRKLHAFRLKQDVFDIKPTRPESTPRKLSISQDVVLALAEKQKLHGLLEDKAPSIPRQNSLSRLLLSRKKSTRFHRERATLHLIPEPSTLVTTWLNDSDTFEGHTCYHFVRNAKLKPPSNVSPRHYHIYLCDTRDVISNIAQYVLTYRRNELCAFNLPSEALQVAVMTAIERKLCTSLAKCIKDWTYGFTLHSDENKVVQKMIQWSKLPPTSPQFGLAPEFIISWDNVIEQLESIENELVPSIKLNHLLSAAKDIYTNFAKHTLNARALAADDFLPIFIYCVCNSKLKTPLTTLEYMWSLCSQESLAVFVDGPFEVPYEPTADEHVKKIEEMSEAELAEFKLSMEQFAWYLFDQDEQAEEKTYFAYRGVNEAIEYIRGICETQGPFHGVFGFSQGGMFAGHLLALEESNDPRRLGFSFGIFCAAGPMTDPKFKIVPEQPLKAPTLHIMGEQDEVVAMNRSQELAEMFQDAQVFVHPGGHYIPTQKEPRMAWKTFLEAQAARLRETS
ncbi:serine hydrolase (FSH1) [Thraustotheca clavata]|uniref:Serine hydrolase (FSH1) n=1 Tax=Thraustotheca clavata TaxID=74557 RepID=A0A1V9ZZ80_9STRA|nr:serine hydrolase (FSH1) [Thraustotheca clavata]